MFLEDPPRCVAQQLHRSSTTVFPSVLREGPYLHQYLSSGLRSSCEVLDHIHADGVRFTYFFTFYIGRDGVGGRCHVEVRDKLMELILSFHPVSSGIEPWLSG